MAMVKIWRRDLFPAEKRCNLVQLDEQWTTAEIIFVDSLAPVLSQMLERLLSDVEKILLEKNYPAISDIKLGFRDKLVNIVRQQMFDAFKMGKTGVYSEFSIRGEVKVEASQRDYFNAKAEAVVDDIQGKVRTETIYTVLAGIKAEKTVDQILAEVKGPAYKSVPAPEGELIHA